jgi:hypothetical protein
MRNNFSIFFLRGLMLHAFLTRDQYVIGYHQSKSRCERHVFIYLPAFLVRDKFASASVNQQRDEYWQLAASRIIFTPWARFGNCGFLSVHATRAAESGGNKGYELLGVTVQVLPKSAERAASRMSGEQQKLRRAHNSALAFRRTAELGSQQRRRSLAHSTSSTINFHAI